MPMGTRAQLHAGVILDESAAPGANYDKAGFRLWLPADASSIRAIVVMGSESNGDGRSEVNDPAWQECIPYKARRLRGTDSYRAVSNADATYSTL